MHIQTGNAYLASAWAAGPTGKARTYAAAPPAAGTTAKSADTVAISQQGRDLLAQNSAAPSSAAKARYDTDQGAVDLDIDAYFTPGASQSGGTLQQELPPLLLPTRNNISALKEHISAALPDFLARNGIPSAPASITYDQNGQIQLPDDYPYAAQFKQALADNPAMERELRTVHALTSTVAEMDKSLPFQRDYAATSSRAEIDAVVAKYSYLFSDQRPYDTIALRFSADGRLSLSDNGKPWA